ncbi:MAG: dockerin type I domain-containing protein, partial [Candidatus Marinimicrobia bacterium]|nr:dockerin type I domain-containing protein [Candidatus Neomarinimicrobiota bacterium]
SLLEIPPSASQYLTNIECTASVLGDINGDSLVNIQDIILTVNVVLSNEYNSSTDLNLDGEVNILDIVALVNIILSR